MRDFDQEVAEMEARQAHLESDFKVKTVAVLLATRWHGTGNWVDWDVWEESITDDDRLDFLETAQAIVNLLKEEK